MAETTILLTQNERRILQFLMERSWPLSVSEMVRLTKISKRTVYYGLNNLRYLFRQLDIGDLSQEAEGFLLTEKQREVLSIYLTEGSGVQWDKKDRISYIICAAICADWELRFKTLEEKFIMSRNAVFADLGDARKELANYHLDLKNSKREGYYVEGDLLLMRTVFQLHISRLLGSPSREQLDFFRQEDIEAYREKISCINERLQLSLNSGVQMELVYLMLMIHKRPGCSSMQFVDAEFIRKTREWNAVDEVLGRLKEQEKNYLAICLMNFSNGSNFAGEWDEDLELWECAKRLIDLFEIIACVSFEEKQELIHAIYMHMKLSCYNYRNMVPHINPLYEEIVQNYQDLYKMTQSCCERMIQDFPYPVDDNEIAYLTMHFGAGMHHASHNAMTAHVLISCPNITTSALLLKTEVEKQFDNIVVEDVVSTRDINYYPLEKQIDFVISTVSFECRYPVIRVGAILTDEDKANIATLMMLLDINSNSDSMQLKILLGIVKRNVDDETYGRIRRDLNRYLNTEGVLVKVPAVRQAGLYNMLKKYGIQYVEHASDDWAKAIRETSVSLLEAGGIEARYIEQILEMGKIHGAYFVINNDIAIAHARPQDGVRNLGVCLSIYRNGLTIIQKKIHFLFVLATPDQQAHLHILENIMRLCNDEGTLKQLLVAQNEKAALDILSDYQ